MNPGRPRRRCVSEAAEKFGGGVRRNINQILFRGDRDTDDHSNDHSVKAKRHCNPRHYIPGEPRRVTRVTIVAQNSKPKFRALSARHRTRHSHARDSLNHRPRRPTLARSRTDRAHRARRPPSSTCSTRSKVRAREKSGRPTTAFSGSRLRADLQDSSLRSPRARCHDARDCKREGRARVLLSTVLHRNASYFDRHER